MKTRHQAPVALLALAMLAAACTGIPAATATPPPPPPTGTPAPAPPSPRPTATPDPRLPAGVSWIEDGELDPGTYWFNGFNPWLELTVPSDGWEVGHFHPDFFDLFHAGDFPSIGFGRFATVKHRDGTTFDATDAQTIVTALKANPELEVTDIGPASIAGRTGLTIEMRAKNQQVPLFGSLGGDFNFDPEFLSRWHILDVEGGAFEILVAARPGHLEDAIATTQPILDSVRIVGP